ncbi:acyl-[ACP]--phospholipid O-acyltransferase [Arhodomonas sp. AD133]|uniref:acyl-[ACP]--phospholipid O-acyltransferase n=1 Tax=Arhodomonas sp. AD133 TaxID=3415009 RepID=UPI003EBBE341
MPRMTARTGFLPFITVVFLNAFVDLGHKIIIQNTLFKTFDGSLQIALTAVVNALILLPFVLVFTPAGFLSDRFAKPRVMRASAFVAVAITLGITACYYLGWFWPAFALTFALALQSAIYSPAKFGYIRELVGEAQLAPANGAVQAVTTVAILGGTFAFSVVFEGLFAGSGATDPQATVAAIAPVGWLLVTASGAEFLLTLRLPHREPARPGMRFDWSRYARADYLCVNLRAAWSRPAVRLPIIGLSVFWAISQVMVAVFPAYAKARLGIDNTIVLQGTVACSGIGIIVGALLAGRWSRGYIETGLIPVGTLGIATALFLLPGLPTIAAHAANFLALGMLGGFVLVPLNSLVQFNAGREGLGRVLAASNFIQNIVMLAFLGLTLLATTAAFGTIALFVFLGITALVAALYTIVKLPQSLSRFVVARLLSPRYRLQVQGLDHLPSEGGVLLLGNHVSWLDWAMVQIACPRPIRFVMERSIYERWYLRWLLDAFGAIPIARGRSADALRSVTECLNNGEVVCLFPEGQISRNGHLGEFKRGFERAAAEADGVIVPFYILGLWGSRFSRAGSGMRERRRAWRARDVVFGFGKALPMVTGAAGVKQAVMELSVECWQARARTLPSLPAAWLRTAKRCGNAPAVADSTDAWIGSRRLLAGVLAFARYLQQGTHGRRLGILLPPSSAGMIANLAALLTGRAVVNLNYSAPSAAIRAAIARAGITEVVTDARFVARLESRGLNVDSVLAGVRRHDIEDFRNAMTRGARMLALLATWLPCALLERAFGHRPDPDATAAIVFSGESGSTLEGVELSHRNILANAHQVADVFDTETDDVMLGNLPLFHAFGLTVTTLLPAVEGVPVVCHPDPSDTIGSAKAIARHRVTVMCSTSSLLRLFARKRRIHPLMLESLRLVVADAEQLEAKAREAFEQRFTKRIHVGFGATEVTPVATCNVPDRLDTRSWQVQIGQRPGTVGMPLPGTVVRVVDPETNETLPAGEDGLILVGGVQVMKGYLDDPARTAEAVVEIDGMRWYRTGNRGHVDADGFLTIVDHNPRFAEIDRGTAKALARDAVSA